VEAELGNLRIGIGEVNLEGGEDFENLNKLLGGKRSV